MSGAAAALLALLPALLHTGGAAGKASAAGGQRPAVQRPAVQEEDVRTFASHGQAVTRGLIPAGEAGGLAGRLRSLLAEHGRRAFGEKGGGKEVRFTFAVHELDPQVAAFVGSRGGRLWQAARELAGSEDLCLLMDRGFSKDPGDPETHWHRDDEAIGLPALHPELRTVHAWIPLATMGQEMGTLRYVVGTQRRSYGWFERLLASLWGWEFAWFVASPIVQDDALELGDVAWHDGWVLHSAGPNTAGSVRDGLAVSFAYCASPSGCGGAATRVSEADVGCRMAGRLFDEGWRARHRSGENDYAKHVIQEPLLIRAARFTWRSIVGAFAGLAIHWVVVNGCCRKRKVS